jgi:hypothetical protein
VARGKKPSRRPKPKARHKSRAATRPARRREPDLLNDVGAILSSGSPLDLLTMASGLMTVLDPREADPFGERQSLMTLAEFAQTLIEVPNTETSALLAAVGALTQDSLLATRIRKELACRPMPLPEWMGALSRTTVDRVVALADDLGDGENIMLGARIAGRYPLTASAYVDHNLGTVVKDVFVVDEPLETVLTQLSRHSELDADTTMRELDPADARARLTEAIGHGAITYPPYETDTWPAGRPLVEWLCAVLPSGGVGHDRREWAEAELLDIAGRFFGSPQGRPMDGSDSRSLLDSLLWYGTGYSNGDPFRWSPAKVEVLLLDWIPRKIVAKANYLSTAPEVLRAFVRFAHAEVGIPDALTGVTLAAIEDFEPQYQQLIRTPRPQGPAALLASIGALDPEEAVADPAGFWLSDALERAVGGPEALETLDATPLPDEPFDWGGITPDIHAAVDGVLAVIDDKVSSLLGTEYRTACRRLVHRVAVGDPTVFRRTARPEVGAAAACWIVAKANRLFAGPERMLVKDLLAHFGVTGSVSQRARAMLRAGGFEADSHDLHLGSVDLLTSERRQRIIDLRDGDPYDF